MEPKKEHIIITFFQTHKGFLLGFLLGGLGMYFYIFSIQGAVNKITILEQNMNALVNQTNQNTQVISNVVQFIDNAVKNSEKK